MDQSQQSYDRHSQYRQPTEYELQALAASSANQMSKIQQHYDQGSSAKASTVPTANGYSQLPQYPDPDVSTYRWDAASGYYYDDSTGLYYDANSQYYYNMTTQEFMYWDGRPRLTSPYPTQKPRHQSLQILRNQQKCLKRKKRRKTKLKT
ncbi:hypothetical protein EB796_005399 [Bugula neritina]|uniref:OCRE domain-containing protein n=1 Tax=Bugula neritina TaxID=10212 RepID=A0A7J7KDE8_BUGNE|nr:hypothetical protein EB796_005399 [Bugula neritina]